MSAQLAGRAGLHHSTRPSPSVTTIDLTAFHLFLPEMTLHTQSGCEPECEGGAAAEVSPSPPDESLGGWLNAQRDQYSEELRFPEVACTPERTQHYDQEAVEAFWNAWRQDVGTAVSGPLDGVPETGGATTEAAGAAPGGTGLWPSPSPSSARPAGTGAAWPHSWPPDTGQRTQLAARHDRGPRPV